MKSRYYRWRANRSTPAVTDIPALAVALGVDEEAVVLAVYRTELARAGIVPAPAVKPRRSRRAS